MVILSTRQENSEEGPESTKPGRKVLAFLLVAYISHPVGELCVSARSGISVEDRKAQNPAGKR